MVCEFCQKEHNGDFATGRFCNRKCALSFSRLKRKPREIKIEFLIDENGCHICTSHKKNDNGYPACKRGLISRFLYEKNFGPIEKGKVLRHSCDNRMCININHLLVGTHQDNVKDRVKRNRSAIGEKNGNSKLTKNQVLEILKSNLSNKKLAGNFNVDRTTISNIKRLISWKK